MSSEGFTNRSMTVLFGIIAVAVIIFFAISMFPKSYIIRDTITEDAVITGVTGGNCIADTKDDPMSSKIIKGCDLSIGTKVTISYKKGLPNAEIVSP